MDYQQSIKNFNKLKILISPWAECQIFFFFGCETEYTVEIFNFLVTSEQQEKINDYRSRTTPYAYIRHRNGDEEVLYYSDDNVSIEYDLFTQDYIFFHCHFRVDKKLLQEQFLMLENMLKNK
jgi:hypothetical protein